jgi:hypothetical protein
MTVTDGANTYYVGGSLRPTFTFAKLISGSWVATDPTTIKLKFKTPAGVVTTYTYGVDAQVVRSGTGVYYFDLSFTTHGEWWYRAEGTGAVEEAFEKYLNVRNSQFD